MRIGKKSWLCVGLLLLAMTLGAEEVVEKVPYGDFESWTVRYIQESKIIGGKMQTLYAIAPTDTLYDNQAFRYEGKYGKGHNPWCVSNTYAKVAGVEKGSGTVYPEKRGNGYCCRMDSKLDELVAMGIVNLKILVAGTVFFGRTIEPVKTAKDPYQNIDFGVPFTRQPKALLFDYKANISPDRTITEAKGAGKPKEIAGHDEAEVALLLQRRWEDADGNIYAVRVGTAYERYSHSQTQWVNNHRLEVHYGDITEEPYFRPYMGLQKQARAMNSKGKIVPIQEVGWGNEQDKPTHMMLSFSSGCYEAFYGHDGNSFWVDNVRLVFEK